MLEPARCVCRDGPHCRWLTRNHGPSRRRSRWRQSACRGRLPSLAARLTRSRVGARRYPGSIEDCGDAVCLSPRWDDAGPNHSSSRDHHDALAAPHFEARTFTGGNQSAMIRRVTDALDGERIAVREALCPMVAHFPLATITPARGEEMECTARLVMIACRLRRLARSISRSLATATC